MGVCALGQSQRGCLIKSERELHVAKTPGIHRDKRPVLRRHYDPGTTAVDPTSPRTQRLAQTQTKTLRSELTALQEPVYAGTGAWVHPLHQLRSEAPAPKFNPAKHGLRCCILESTETMLSGLSVEATGGLVAPSRETQILIACRRRWRAWPCPAA